MHKEDIRPAIPKSEAIDTWYQEYDRRYPSAGDIIVTSVTKLVPRSITGNLGTAMMNVAVRLQNWGTGIQPVCYAYDSGNRLQDILLL